MRSVACEERESSRDNDSDEFSDGVSSDVVCVCARRACRSAMNRLAPETTLTEHGRRKRECVKWALRSGECGACWSIRNFHITVNWLHRVIWYCSLHEHRRYALRVPLKRNLAKAWPWQDKYLGTKAGCIRTQYMASLHIMHPHSQRVLPLTCELRLALTRSNCAFNTADMDASHVTLVACIHKSLLVEVRLFAHVQKQACVNWFHRVMVSAHCMNIEGMH
jgi:hypothetical protein